MKVKDIMSCIDDSVDTVDIESTLFFRRVRGAGSEPLTEELAERKVISIKVECEGMITILVEEK